MILLYSLVTRLEPFISRLTSLPASKITCSIYILNQYIIVISIDHRQMYSIQFKSLFNSCIFIMAYSKTNLKRNGDKASPGIGPS